MITWLVPIGSQDDYYGVYDNGVVDCKHYHVHCMWLEQDAKCFEGDLDMEMLFDRGYHQYYHMLETWLQSHAKTIHPKQASSSFQ